MSGCLLALFRAYSAEVTVDNRLTGLEIDGETELTGAGGVIVQSLAIPEGARLVFDPVATPIKVAAVPAFADGAKIALPSDYASACALPLSDVVLRPECLLCSNLPLIAPTPELPTRRCLLYAEAARYHARHCREGQICNCPHRNLTLGN